ncbi:MAG: hypothetical protein ACE37F_11400 [Nannocystaceae bacterium]|nr:hypothetical protein [bacterium]
MSDPKRLEARFEALEGAARRDEADFGRWLSHMNALRTLAHDRASLRLRFASSWLRTGLDAAAVRHGAIENDRSAYLWSLDAAHAGRPHGAVLVGHCYRDGRGARRSLRRARRWYRRGARSGSVEAAFWLTATENHLSKWLLYRGPALEWVGLGFLAVHLLVAPWSFSFAAVMVYVVVALGGQLLVRWMMGRAMPEPQVADASTGRELVDELVDRPWKTLAVAGEDGLVLVPLLAVAGLLGVGFGPVAMAAGLLFGLLHYPNFSWRACLAKGLTYAAAVGLVVPWGGLAALAVGHILLDGMIVAMAWTERARLRRSLQRG